MSDKLEELERLVKRAKGAIAVKQASACQGVVRGTEELVQISGDLCDLCLDLRQTAIDIQLQEREDVLLKKLSNQEGI